MNESDYENLRYMVEKYGISLVISRLGTVCAEKAEHLMQQGNAYDAMNWENASSVLIRHFAEHKSIEIVSPFD